MLYAVNMQKEGGRYEKGSQNMQKNEKKRFKITNVYCDFNIIPYQLRYV